MATTVLPNSKIGYPAVGDTGFATVWQANMVTLDGMQPVGGLYCSTHEQPASTSLLVDVAPGAFRTPWGQTVSYAGVSSHAMTANTTTFLWLTAAGVLTTGASFPGTAYVPIAKVVAGTATVSSITDLRNVCSTVVPVAQPTLGSATAGSSYGTNEQTMLQAVYNLARTLGLGT